MTAAAFLLLSVTTISFFISNLHLCGLHHSNQETFQHAEEVFMCFPISPHYLLTIFTHLFVFPSFWEMATVTSTGVDEGCGPAFNAGLKKHSSTRADRNERET